MSTVSIDNSYPCPPTIEIHPMLQQHERQTYLFLSAGVAASVTSTFYNPLDCLRVRWQVSSTSSPQGLVTFAQQICRNEGIVSGLWLPGIAANAFGMGISAALRFGYYERVRDGFIGHAYDSRHGQYTSSESKNVIHMAAAGKNELVLMKHFFCIRSITVR